VGGAIQGAGMFFVGLTQGDWRYVIEGWQFALPLLLILLIHELGHYLAARRYAMKVSPPYFLPIPPTLSPIGSLGAYISLRSPVLDRRQLLDVGAAGPLAGFVVAVVVLAWGYLGSDRMPFPAADPAGIVVFAGHPILLGDSLLTHWMATWLVPGTGTVRLSLPAFAGWVGAFITALNLLPLSQLDGGHILYGLVGRRQAGAGLLVVALLLVLAQSSWSWYVWVALAMVLGRGRWSHPQVIAPHHPLSRGRRAIGWLCMLILAAAFVPVPFGR
jgi:membrane-associated protease RseP (regulator of RpoE activity)